MKKLHTKGEKMANSVTWCYCLITSSYKLLTDFEYSLSLSLTHTHMLEPDKFKILKPLQLQDFDDGRTLLPHDDCSTSDEDY